MSTPFPGMDPYLERRGLWEGVHTRLLVALADAIAPQVRPRYRVDVEQRTYLAVMTPDDLIGKPDVLVLATREPRAAYSTSRPPGPVPVEIAELPMPEEVVERYLEIRDLGSGDVVTVIELLSHSNKSNREGRAQYDRKRLAVLASLTHLIEIDLLRAGDPMPMRISGNGNRTDYRILISRSHQRPLADAYRFGVRDAIPDVPVPLRNGEPEPILMLNQILHELYDRAGYDLAVDYSQPPVPPLVADDADWAVSLLAQLSTVIPGGPQQ